MGLILVTIKLYSETGSLKIWPSEFSSNLCCSERRFICGDYLVNLPDLVPSRLQLLDPFEFWLLHSQHICKVPGEEWLITITRTMICILNQRELSLCSLLCMS